MRGRQKKGHKKRATHCTAVVGEDGKRIQRKRQRDEIIEVVDED